MPRVIYLPTIEAEKYPDKAIIEDNECIPKDIFKFIDEGKNVQRIAHPDYPKGVFADNVKAHLIRLAKTAQIIPLPKNLESQRTKLERMLWVHDIPEIAESTEQGFDTSAVIKEENPDLEKQIDLSEDEVAKMLLSDEDYVLYHGFELGKERSMEERNFMIKLINLVF